MIGMVSCYNGLNILELLLTTLNFIRQVAISIILRLLT